MLCLKNSLLYIIFVLQTTLCTKMNKQSSTTREWEETWLNDKNESKKESYFVWIKLVQIDICDKSVIPMAIATCFSSKSQKRFGSNLQVLFKLGLTI